MNVTVKLLTSCTLFISLIICVENGYSQACVSGGVVHGPVTLTDSNKTITGYRINGGSGTCISLTNCKNITITCLPAYIFFGSTMETTSLPGKC